MTCFLTFMWVVFINYRKTNSKEIKPFKKVAIIAMFFTALHLVEDMIWLAIGRYTEVPFWAVILAIICFGILGGIVMRHSKVKGFLGK